MQIRVNRTTWSVIDATFIGFTLMLLLAFMSYGPEECFRFVGLLD